MRVSIIGCGAMGGAMARGLLECGAIEPKELTVSDPDKQKLSFFKEIGANIASGNESVFGGADLVVVAVKPWLLKDVIEEIKPVVKKDVEICFIAAGPGPEEIKLMFGPCHPDNMSVAMPNTAMITRQSMTFIARVEGVPSLAMEVFSHLGKVMEIEARLLPAATALASCGIAYAFRYVRAACEGGVELGFSAAGAKEIIVQTITGAMSILSLPGSHPEVEIDKVTTPGGITIKGLNAMERAGFSSAVIAGLKESARRD